MERRDEGLRSVADWAGRRGHAQGFT